MRFLEYHYSFPPSLAIILSFLSVSAALCKSAAVEPQHWKSRTQLLASWPINPSSLALFPVTLSHNSKPSICGVTEL